jgi:hypothetical protein
MAEKYSHQCDHCDKKLELEFEYQKYDAIWCIPCANNEASYFDARAIPFGGPYSETRPRNYVSWSDPISKSLLAEIPKKTVEPKEATEATEAKTFKKDGIHIPCEHCGEPVDLTGSGRHSVSSEEVLWCYKCHQEETKTLREKIITVHPTAHVKGKFALWVSSNNVSKLRLIPKKLLDGSEKVNHSCDHCSVPLSKEELPSHKECSLFWCKSCHTEDNQLLLDISVNEGADKSTYGTNSRGWFNPSGIAKIVALPKKIKIEEPVKEVMTCDCKVCGKLLPKDKIWTDNSRIDTDYAWCKGCVDQHRAELWSKCFLSCESEKSYAAFGYEGEVWTPASREKAKRFIEKKKEAEKFIECGCCGKQLRKEHVWHGSSNQYLLEYAWCKECCLTHRKALDDGPSVSCLNDTYNTRPELIGEIFLGNYIEKCKAFAAALKQPKKETVEDKKPIEINTNCGHCGKDINITAVPNYELYWCDGCLSEDISLLHSYSALADRSVPGGIAWGKSSQNLAKAKAIPTKQELAKAKELSIEFRTCDHCGKLIEKSKIWGSKLNDFSDRTCWCKTCVSENRDSLVKDGVIVLSEDNYTSKDLEGEILDSSSVEKIKSYPKKEDPKKEDPKKEEVKLCSCDHCGKSLVASLVYVANGEFSKDFVWCKECVIENSQAITDRAVSFISESLYKTTAYAKYVGETFAPIDRIRMKDFPKKAEASVEVKLSETEVKLSEIVAKLSKIEEKLAEQPKPVEAAITMIECDHCNKQLDRSRVYYGHIQNSLAWCKECVIEDKALLREKDIGSLDASNYRGQTAHYIAEAWTSTTDLANLRSIPKKTKKVACAHCNTHLDVEHNFDEATHIIWCRSCCIEDQHLLCNVDHFVAGGFPESKGQSWRASDKEIVSAIPKKMSCDHCGVRVFKPDVMGQTPGAVLWCASCSTEDKKLLNDNGIIGLALASLSTNGGMYDSEGWFHSDLTKVIKAIPKKVLNNCKCHHCGKEFHHAAADKNGVAWCSGCVSENAAFLTELGLTADCGHHQGFVWGIAKNVEKVKIIPPKDAVNNTSCDHCGKGLHFRSLNETNSKDHVAWCRECSAKENDKLKKISLPLDPAELIVGQFWQPHNSGYQAVKDLPKVANTCCDHCGKEFFAQCVRDEKNTWVSWCQDCCTTDIEQLKSVSAVSSIVGLSANGLNWTSTSPSHQKVKELPRQDNTTCDHCGKSFYSKVVRDKKPTNYISWCKDCGIKDVSLLQKVGVLYLNEEQLKDIPGETWYLDERSIEKVRTIPKKNNCVCDHCDKELHHETYHGSGVVWCKDCVKEDTAKLETAGLAVGGERHHHWISNAEKVSAIPKKENAACDHCDKKLRIDPSLANETNTVWCGPCLIEDVEELRKHNLPGTDHIQGAWTTWDNPHDREVLKSIPKHKDIDRKQANKASTMTEKQCPCYICGAATTDYNKIYKETDKWHNTCFSCSVQIYLKQRSNASSVPVEGTGFPQVDSSKIWSVALEAVRVAFNEKQEKEAAQRALDLEEEKKKIALRSIELQQATHRANAKLVSKIGTNKVSEVIKHLNSQCPCDICGKMTKGWAKDSGFIADTYYETCHDCTMEIVPKVPFCNYPDTEWGNRKEGWAFVRGSTESDPIIREMKIPKTTEETKMSSTNTVCVCCGSSCPDNGSDWQNTCVICAVKVLTKFAVRTGANKNGAIEHAKSNNGIGLTSAYRQELEEVKAECTSKAIKTPPSVKRMSLASEVIEALREVAYPFGSFVRDLFANEDFENLDLFFPQFDTQYPKNDPQHTDHISFNTVVPALLMRKGFAVAQLPDKISLHAKEQDVYLNKKRFAITDKDGTSIEIGLVSSTADKARAGHDNPFLLRDADVNCLYLDRAANTYKTAPGYDIKTVISNIDQRHFDLPKTSGIDAKRIDKLTEKGYTPTNNMTIDKSTLKVGDLIQIVIRNPETGETFFRDATVFGNAYAPRVVLNEAVKSSSGTSWALSFSDLEAAKRVGKNPGTNQVGWQIDKNTDIVSLLGNVIPPPPPLDQNSLEVGDKVEIAYTGSNALGQPFHLLGEGVVIRKKGIDQPLLFTLNGGVFKDPIDQIETVAGWNANAEQVEIMKKYAIDAKTPIIAAHQTIIPTKLIGKLEETPIDPDTIFIGDKVEVEVNLKNANFTRTDEKITRTAYVIGISSGIRYLALEETVKPADGAASPCLYIPDYTEFYNEAKRLGLNTSIKNGWKVQKENTKIKKVLEKAPPLIDAYTVEVGRKYEVEVSPGRYGTAICIEKSGTVPIWGFEKRPGLNLSTPGATQQLLFQKYGLAQDNTCWITDSLTKIRKDLGPADVYLDQKTLKVGDVIELEMAFSGKSLGMNTAVISEIDALGRYVLVTQKQINGMTGTASAGLYAHAAKNMGWDPMTSGTWLLQPYTDKVISKINTIEMKYKPISEFKVGDLIEVEIIGTGVNLKTEALIASTNKDSATIIFGNRNDIGVNPDANTKKIAEKYGFGTEGTAYNISSSNAIIHKALGKASIKSVSPSTLKVGDRVDVCLGHGNASPAVVIQSAEDSAYKGEPVVAFETEIIGCWALDQHQKELASKYGLKGTKIGRRIDGRETFVTKVLGRKSLATSTLKVGDRLSLEFGVPYANSTKFPEEATVIAINGEEATVVFNEVYRDLSGAITSSSFPDFNQKEQAAKVGITLADNDARIFRFNNSGVVLITDVSSPTLQEKKEMETPNINPASLQTGDRVLIEIDTPYGKEEVEATTLGVDYCGYPLVFLEGPQKHAFTFSQPVNIAACEALGFDPKDKRGWDLHPSKAKILKMLDEKHAIDLDDINIGDRILIEYREDDEIVFTKEATYLGEDDMSDLSVAYFNEVIDTADSTSWTADKNTVPNLAAKKLDLDPDEEHFLNINGESFTIRKIVSRSKVELSQRDLEKEAIKLQVEEEEEEEEEIEDETNEEETEEIFVDESTLEVGDIVEVKVIATETEDFIITKGVVIDPDHAGGPLLAIDEAFSFEGDDEVAPEPFKLLGKDLIKKAKKLGINPEKKVAWNIDGFTRVIKVLGNATKHDADASQNKEKHMPYDTDGEEISVLDMLKADALNAGYRVAANQMTKGVKGAILLSMQDKGVEGSKIQAISEMLDTDLGDAFVSTLLGYGLTYIPVLAEDPRAQALAEEFRINGMAIAGNVVADSVFQHLMPAINSAMEKLPPAEEVLRMKRPSRKRVASPKVETKELVEASGGEEVGKAASKRSGASV